VIPSGERGESRATGSMWNTDLVKGARAGRGMLILLFSRRREIIGRGGRAAPVATSKEEDSELPVFGAPRRPAGLVSPAAFGSF
jgi:hypothetical protein